MTQVSIGQVENLEDLLRGLLSLRETLDTACRAQVAVAERQCAAVQEEAMSSEAMLKQASQDELAAHQAMTEARRNLESAQNVLEAAESALSECGG